MRGCLCMRACVRACVCVKRNAKGTSNDRNGEDWGLRSNSKAKDSLTIASKANFGFTTVGVGGVAHTCTP